MFKEKTGLKGIVRIEVTDKDGNAKSLFQGNAFWSLLKKWLKLDIKLPFITGRYTQEGVMYNTITAAGLVHAAKLLGGIGGGAAISHMAIGIGSPAANALGSEISSGGGARAAVTPTSQETNIADDTVRSVKTFEFTGSFAVTEEGLFNHESAGDAIATRSFSAINVANGDSLQITHDIVMSTT